MSQLASFTALSVPAVHTLVPRALVETRLFRKPVSRLSEYLAKHGKDLGSFDADGFYVVLVLMYLKEYENINLMDANRGLALLAQSLTKYHGSFFSFFTDEDRVHHTAIRAVTFDETKLRQLCEINAVEYEFYSHLLTTKAAAEKIADLLAQINDGHVVLVSVG